MNKQLYIAYGSNLNKEQMMYRCPDAEIVGVGQLPNYRLEFRRVLTVVPYAGSRIPVAVWKISRDDRAKLDRYEGYPSYYRQEALHVDFSDGSHCSAMAYLMNGGFIAPPPISYEKVVRQGYKDFNLDTKYLDAALERSRKKAATF